ncbi:hypothetical protein CBER1_09226 [Cercospora berteroae]|uniref:Uncharacterized protein n=1 Tax=Cercospora berteroae TaxID=357750 RepID=A0A2S6BVG6_9PEZI|nr:hypothetical protein CBER1_09226 [Cercospora berteroae]
MQHSIMDPEARYIWNHRIRQMRAFNSYTTQHSTMDLEDRDIWDERDQSAECVEEREGYLECLYPDVAQEPFEFNYEAAMGLVWWGDAHLLNSRGNIVRRRNDEEERRQWVTGHSRIVTLRPERMAGRRAEVEEQSDDESDDGILIPRLDPDSFDRRLPHERVMMAQVPPERSEIFEPGQPMDWSDAIRRVEALQRSTAEMRLSLDRLEDAIGGVFRRTHGLENTAEEVRPSEEIEEAGLEPSDELENEDVEMDGAVTPQSDSGSSR